MQVYKIQGLIVHPVEGQSLEGTRETLHETQTRRRPGADPDVSGTSTSIQMSSIPKITAQVQQIYHAGAATARIDEPRLETILVVEGEKIIRRPIRIALERKECQVLKDISGEDALDLCRSLSPTLKFSPKCDRFLTPPPI